MNSCRGGGGWDGVFCAGVIGDGGGYWDVGVEWLQE